MTMTALEVAILKQLPADRPTLRVWGRKNGYGVAFVDATLTAMGFDGKIVPIGGLLYPMDSKAEPEQPPRDPLQEIADSENDRSKP